MAEGQDNYVGLNVGGRIFKTSRTTMLAYPESFFSGLLGGAIPSAKDDQGNYLIDQDGEVFRHVLNFMRYNELVLPEGFKEYGVLERQADFFQLESLKSSIERPMQVDGSEAVGLMCRDGKVFHTTREILMREKDSYFTKMLSEESTVERDFQGHYFLHDISNSELIQHALSYLTHGGILDPINNMDVVRWYLNSAETVYPFKLKGFRSHCALMNFAGSLDIGKLTRTRLCFYYNLNSLGFAYIQRPDLMDTTCTPNTVRMLRDRLFLKRVRITEHVDAGMVNMKYINNNLPASLQDVITYFKLDKREKINTYTISPNCIRLEITYASN
nr:BTB/POZ domain-containing protein KCTD21-like [Lytechinus pictus]